MPPYDDNWTKIKGRVILARRQQQRRPYENVNLSRSTGQSAPQTAGNPNNNGTQPQQNPFSFGSQSQSFGGTQNPVPNSQGFTQSASFPSFNTAAASNTGFNFSNGSNVKNPFEVGTSNARGSAPSIQSVGYQGSIFNIPPPTPPTVNQGDAAALEAKAKAKAEREQRRAIENSTPLWANDMNPFANAPSSDQTGQGQQSQPVANGLGIQNTSQPQQTSSGPPNDAGSLNVSQTQQPSFNLFNNAQAKPPTANMFSSVQSQQPAPTQSTPNPLGETPSQPHSNPFGQTVPQQSTPMFSMSQPQQLATGNSGLVQQQPNTPSAGYSNPFGTRTNQSTPNQSISNIFSALQPQSNTSSWMGAPKSQQPAPNAVGTSQPTSSIFSHLQNQQQQPLSNFFGNNPTQNQVQKPMSPIQTGDDSMSTTPDTSPMQAQQAQQTVQSNQEANAFLDSLAPPSPSPQVKTGSLFDRISRPDGQAVSTATSGDISQTPQAEATSLFDRVSQPSEVQNQSGKDDAQSFSPRPEAPKNIFTGFGQPSASMMGTGSNGSKDPEHQPPKSIFSNFGQSSASRTDASGYLPKEADSETVKNIFRNLGRPSVGTTNSSDYQQKQAESKTPQKISSNMGPPSVNIDQSSNNDESSMSSTNTGLSKSTIPDFGMKHTSKAEQVSNTLDSNAADLFPGQSQSKSDRSNIGDIFAPSNQLSAPLSSSAYLPSTTASVPAFQSPTGIVQDGYKPPTEYGSPQSSNNLARIPPQSKRRPGAPPTPPQDFSDDEKQQLITSYRLKAFDAGFKRFFRFDTIEDLGAALTYCQNRREAILNAAGHPTVDAAGSKRKSSLSDNSATPKKARVDTTDTPTPSDLHQVENEPSAKRSRSRFNHDLASYASAPMPPSPPKRKADELLSSDEPIEAGSSLKKTRNKGPMTYPSLTSPDSSHTSNIFKRIVSDPEVQSTLPSVAGLQDVSASATPAKAPAANMFSSSKSSAAVTEPKFSTRDVAPSTASHKHSPAEAAKPTIKPPTFSSGASANFMSQFQQMSKKEEQAEKSKRKANDLDSDEDDTEWERQYEEEQEAKKSRVNEAVKGKKFVLGKGLVYPDEKPENSLFLEPGEPRDRGSNGSSPAPQSRDSSVSILDQPQKPFPNGMNNIFGHLSDVGSGAEGSNVGDTDDEDTASEGSESGADNHDPSGITSDNVGQIAQSRASINSFSSINAKPNTETPQQTRNEPSVSRSLFDRIEKDEDGNLLRETPVAEQKKASGLFDATPGTVGGMVKSPLFSAPKITSKQNDKEVSSTDTSPGDRSWKVGNAIKFGGNESRPGLEITSPTPAKPTLGGLFGSSQTDVSANPPSKPIFNLFQSTPPKAPEVGFGISIAKPTDSLAPPDAASNNASRATSPGASSNAESVSESGADGAEHENEKQEQIDLTSAGPGEENETKLFEVKGRAFEFDSSKKGWIAKGVGLIRVLKNPDTGKARILMRQEPSGKIILNAALLSEVEYKHKRPKTVELAVATDSGKLVSYTIRLANDDDAAKLAETLQENKTR
ncbi:MAG: hypothetical protein Q9195_000760 [Heterodermia aff. obscurata]